MQISKKLLFIGLLLEISITVSLFVMLFELHQNLSELKSQHNTLLSKLELSSGNLHKVTEIEDKAEKVTEMLSEDLSSSKLAILRSISSIRGAISDGSQISLVDIKSGLTQEELEAISNYQSKIVVKDSDLIQELKLCLKYTDSNLSRDKQPDRIIIEKIIEIEEEDKYRASIAASQALSSAISVLEMGHYDVALRYLNEIPKQSPVNQCMQAVLDSIKARISTNEILTSLEKRILND